MSKSEAPAEKSVSTATAKPAENRYGVTEKMISDFRAKNFVMNIINTKHPWIILINPVELHVLLHLVLEKYKAAKSPLIELSAPITVCGDIHGQYEDLLRILRACESTEKYLFLGNYIDYGEFQLETIAFLLAYQIHEPKKINMLRGKHEEKTVSRWYGFHKDLKKKYRGHGAAVAESLFDHFNEVFSWMPVAALISERILCMHGGISPELRSLDDIRAIPLPLEDVHLNPLAFDLLWATPDTSAKGYSWAEKETKKQKADRLMYEKIRASYVNRPKYISIDRTDTRIFGKNEVSDMCKKLKIACIISGGQPVEFGYQVFPGNRLITLFSAPRFGDNLRNYGAVANVTKFFELMFVQFEPRDAAKTVAMQYERDKEMNGWRKKDVKGNEGKGAASRGKRQNMNSFGMFLCETDPADPG